MIRSHQFVITLGGNPESGAIVVMDGKPLVGVKDLAVTTTEKRVAEVTLTFYAISGYGPDGHIEEPHTLPLDDA